MPAPGEDMLGIRAASVARWFEANIDGATGPLAFELIAGGNSNLTYKVTDEAGKVYVLRRPPTGAVLATAHDMAREHRIISGVARAGGVPVPVALGLCEDTAVNDAPFYVMSYVEGVVLDSAEKVDESFPDAAPRLVAGEHVVSILANLHAIDADAVGLGDLGRKEDYLARQLRRWRTQWEGSKTRELPVMDELADQLERARPAQIGASIVHGDFRLGNMLTAADGHVAAVLDWELCTLGDPLADVGLLWVYWSDPDGEAVLPAASPTALDGFLRKDEVMARYAAASGRDLTDIAFYQAFAYWKLTCIIAGVYARYAGGAMGADVDQRQVDGFAHLVETLAASAQEAAARVADAPKAGPSR
jgi:aminoglycoside phosphotransferase (APT) family kinase protein